MALDLSGFRDPKLGRELIACIDELAPAALANCAGEVNLMEVCGTHTVTIARNGFRDILPAGVNLISGPGCPVCVTANVDIDTVIAISRIPGVIVTTFGDMTRVPGSTSSLNKEKAAGADIRIVYSPLDALKVAQENPGNEVVFVGVGFETTTPLIAATIKRASDMQLGNFSVIAIHKTMPNTLSVLVNDSQVKLNALILPGHVSTIIGIEPYRFLADKYGVPGVVTGFEPVDVLQGIAMLLRQLANGRVEIENGYTRGVRDEGNPAAVAAINEVFEPCDATWRGLGLIEASGYALRQEYAAFDAVRKLKPQVEPTVEPKGCRCGDVLRGVMTPKDCPLFNTGCSPEHPVGPCMVSSEGSCAAFYKYLR